jgi:hypothetical protein
MPSDAVIFKLKVKNSKRVLVRIFEVKTLEYLQRYTGTIGQALSLDGLTPNWERNYTLDHPPLEIHDLLIELPELANRRGSFIIDVISNGENSTAYFTKVPITNPRMNISSALILSVVPKLMFSFF